MSLNACIVGCKVIKLIGSEATDVVYEGDLWMLMMIYKANAGLGCKWNGIISTISVFYAPWQKKLMHLYIKLLTWSTERTLLINAKLIVKKKNCWTKFNPGFFSACPSNSVIFVTVMIFVSKSFICIKMCLYSVKKIFY